MGKLFCLMGKSSSGKDTIYKRLMGDSALCLRPLVPYTTRPIREGEREGVEYHFVTEAQLEALREAGRVVEIRAYDTVQGVWKYSTVCGEDMDLARDSYAAIGTLASFRALRAYFGASRIVPVYIEVEDGLRLFRALQRERGQAKPRYAELCRRFLADEEDFSEENLKKAGIERRFENIDLEGVLEKIKLFIQKEMGV